MGMASWALQLANFEGIPVRLRGFEMQNISMLWSAFIAQIIRQIKVSLISRPRPAEPFHYSLAFSDQARHTSTLLPVWTVWLQMS